MEGRTRFLEFAVPPALQITLEQAHRTVPGDRASLFPGGLTPRLSFAHQFYLARFLRLFRQAQR